MIITWSNHDWYSHSDLPASSSLSSQSESQFEGLSEPASGVDLGGGSRMEGIWGLGLFVCFVAIPGIA